MARTRKQNGNSDLNNIEFENSEMQEFQPDAIAIQPVDEAVSGGVDRLMEVIEQTVEKYGSDDAEREALRQGVATIVQDTLLEFLRPQDTNMEAMQMGGINPGLENMALGSSGADENAGQAIDAAVRGSQEVGMAFVDFTQGLITGTFNSIIKATIDQMKAYTEMVADLTKSLKEFAAENISDEVVDGKLAQLGEGGAIAINEKRLAYHFKRLYYIAPVTGGHRERILDAFGIEESQYKTEQKKIDEKKVAEELAKDDPFGLDAKLDGDSSKYTDDDIKIIKAAIKHGLAKDGMNQLRQMAREGMARIVITEGEINTKLIFKVASQATDTSDATQNNRRSYGVSARGGAFWGWGSANVNAHYNNMSVSTVDQTSVGNIETLTQMSGQVVLKFKTDYKPLNDGTGSVKESDLAPIA